MLYLTPTRPKSFADSDNLISWLCLCPLAQRGLRKRSLPAVTFTSKVSQDISRMDLIVLSYSMGALHGKKKKKKKSASLFFPKTLVGEGKRSLCTYTIPWMSSRDIRGRVETGPAGAVGELEWLASQIIIIALLILLRCWKEWGGGGGEGIHFFLSFVLNGNSPYDFRFHCDRLRVPYKCPKKNSFSKKFLFFFIFFYIYSRVGIVKKNFTK